MSPWTALFEAFHSALIDELTERHPEPKPELGLPIRTASADLPHPTLEDVAVYRIGFGEAKGYIVIAMDSLGSKAIGANSEELWASLLKRCGQEFSLRKIQPRIEGREELSQIQVGRVVWIPIQISGGRCFLALAV